MLDDDIFDVQDDPTRPQFAGSYPDALVVDWQPINAHIVLLTTSIITCSRIRGIPPS